MSEHPEVRLERLGPAGIQAAMDSAPIAWLPMGALEYHATHLPTGTDGFTGHELLVRAAARAGGVVLPWTYVTMGTLALPWSFRYDPETVTDVLRQTLRQLPTFGVRLAVVHTGHAPLDLIHAIKRICSEVTAEIAADGGAMRCYGVCYLELNATLGTGLGTDWPVAVDHGSTMETSWLAAIEPGLVHLETLPDDPAGATVGVYGPNPRFTADAAQGGTQVDAAAALLADRATRILAGEPFDPLSDLRGFVERYWPEPLVVTARAGGPGEAALLLTNPGPVSRYISSVGLILDGAALPASALALCNPTPGETGIPILGDRLGPERGFYVRRNQTAEVRLPNALDRGRHEIELTLGLAGVTEMRLTTNVTAS